MEGFKKIQIPIPSLELQEEIIKRIEELEEQSSHYNKYSKMLEKELSNITDIINNMTTLSKSNDILLDDTVDDNILDEENDNETNDDNENNILLSIL